MRKIEALQAARTKVDLALLLGIKASTLTYILYVLKPSTQYSSFEIPKKNGGSRVILSPSDRLKALQSSLSELLQDCIEELNKDKAKGQNFESTLAHGFVRDRSIITNAMMHLNKKNVLNVDIKDFFGSFNFGRVRGFFIKNKNFLLDPNIATVIAQIACYNNKLPQGSPCSPVITNLIFHALDIRLASLAKVNSCTYSRYADDITFSTRKKKIPTQIMRDDDGKYTPGRKLRKEVQRAGFELNEKKTRILYKDSRQEVTGLISNKKPNIKQEYWRTIRAQCHSLFMTGSFTKEVNGQKITGNISELEGRLNFIDQVDHYNRLRQKPPLNPEYQRSKHGIKRSNILSGRERTFSQFLYYKLFYGNKQPTILCEGKTDNIYLKSAIRKLVLSYPRLAKPKTKESEYELFVSFFNYTKRTRFLLDLYGGTSYLNMFISEYKKNHNSYSAPKPENPVIIILDNDAGFNSINNTLKNKTSATLHPDKVKKNDFRNAEFIHVTENLYIVLTPKTPTGDGTAIENLFDKKTLSVKVSGKSFNPEDNRDNNREYGKEVFAKKVVMEKKEEIKFTGFQPLLNRIVQCIEHYESIK